MRAIVVGAGVVGASIGFQLTRRGAHVTLVEAGEPGGETSSRSFAWLNANDKPPDAYHRLNAAGIEAHRRLRDTLGSGTWLHDTGNLIYSADMAGLTERVVRLRALGYPAEAIDAARARELEPAVIAPADVRVAFFPSEAWAHGPTLVRTLIEAATERGATVRRQTIVEAIELLAGRARARLASVPAGLGVAPRRRAGVGAANHVATDAAARVARNGAENGEWIEADAIVVAAGRFSDRVAELAGIRLRLRPTCGLLAVTAPIQDGPSRICYLPGVHLRPDGGGRYVLQDGDTDAEVTPETAEDPDLPGCRTLLERAQRYVPALQGARVEQARVGIRPMPEDGFPVVGPAPDEGRVYLAVTHSGMTLGPLIGELAADELLGAEPEPRLATFRPSRLYPRV